MRPLLAALCLLLASAGPSLAQERGDAAVSVAAAPATVGPVPVEVAANGTAQAVSIISVRSRVDGQVERVHVEEGQMVRAGDVLFTLDARTTQALLAQQEANLARDRAQLERAQADARRYASLRSDAFASAQRSEQAQADATALAATVRADEAVVAQTRLTLDFATIRAEAAGRLGALPVKAGNFVRTAEGAVLATITQTDPILVVFSVPERWLAELRAARERGETPGVSAHAPEDTAAPVQGELVFVDSAVDTATGTIQLKARFANAAARLWPGQYLEVVMIPRVDPRAVSVPSAAVRMGAEGNFLYALRPEGTARRVPIRVQRYASGRAVVEGPLADGEQVVTEGIERLRDGIRVAVREPGGRGRPANAPSAQSGVTPPPTRQAEADAR